MHDDGWLARDLHRLVSAVMIIGYVLFLVGWLRIGLRVDPLVGTGLVLVFGPLGGLGLGWLISATKPRPEPTPHTPPPRAPHYVILFRQPVEEPPNNPRPVLLAIESGYQGRGRLIEASYLDGVWRVEATGEAILHGAIWRLLWWAEVPPLD